MTSRILDVCSSCSWVHVRSRRRSRISDNERSGYLRQNRRFSKKYSGEKFRPTKRHPLFLHLYVVGGQKLLPPQEYRADKNAKVDSPFLRDLRDEQSDRDVDKCHHRSFVHDA